ncbi:DNA-binding protein [Stachybotrys elegans]|uniref:DNA-binding protein n=1 Tax=Stachybotrys elegans TaxID=80388 RepID=A0A8K0SW04_9HYPO|nr:DNA-binding protein [Stachybotrys elegans]
MATNSQDPNDGPSLHALAGATLLSSFTDFLTVAIHSLLYHRALYPQRTFLAARAYNLPVHQSRFPKLCAWINDAVAAVADQLRSGCVRRIAVVLHAPATLSVLERWVFDVSTFPDWEPALQSLDELDEDELPEEFSSELVDGLVNWANVNEALRGALRRIAYAAEGLPTPPEGSTFTLAVELRDEAEPPIGHPQPWIPSHSNLQPPTRSSPNQGSALGGATTIPVRSVRADPLFFECWVEQAAPESVPAGTRSKNSQRTHHLKT